MSLLRNSSMSVVQVAAAMLLMAGQLNGPG